MNQIKGGMNDEQWDWLPLIWLAPAPEVVLALSLVAAAHISRKKCRAVLSTPLSTGRR